DVEIDHHAGAVAAPIGGGKIAQDATADLIALGLHRDRLGDGEVAVLLDGHVADEAQDALDRSGGIERGESERNCQRDASQRGHDLPAGNETCGAAACARSSSSKNGSFLKPRIFAMISFGNDWMLMLRLRTAPL